MTIDSQWNFVCVDGVVQCLLIIAYKEDEFVKKTTKESR